MCPIDFRMLKLFVEITENQKVLLIQIPLFISIRLIDRLQILQVLLHIQKICLMTQNKLNSQDL